MSRLVHKRPQSKRRVSITPEIKAQVIELLATTSQQQVARRLGISQAAVSRIARSWRASGSIDITQSEKEAA